MDPADSSGETKQASSAQGNPKLRSQLRSLVPAEAEERFDIEEEVIESGNAAEAIARAAERFRADAICLGSHGRSGLAKTFMGSVAQGVMAKSRRPVLVVRAEKESLDLIYIRNEP